jgi:hypothetical protein
MTTSACHQLPVLLTHCCTSPLLLAGIYAGMATVHWLDCKYKNYNWQVRRLTSRVTDSGRAGMGAVVWQLFVLLSCTVLARLVSVTSCLTSSLTHCCAHIDFMIATTPAYTSTLPTHRLCCFCCAARA